VRKGQANFLAEISGAHAQNKNMGSKIQQLDQESFKQQELLYNVEFQVQQMERKVNRAKGERTEEEKRELKEKIQVLQTMLDDLMKQYKVLDLQVKRVNDDVRQAKVDMANKKKQEKQVTEVILELTLENESCNTELQGLLRQKEALMVQKDVLQLQVNRLKQTVDSGGSALFGLENRTAQLKVTVDEREEEIKVHKDVLLMEAKTAEEERRQLAMELRERKSKVAHLKNRFQVLISRISRDDDDPDGEMTQAQYIVKTAKEREMLQATGDKLDEEIKRIEKEARKLDKTIAVLKGCNVRFKTQFKRAGDEDVETAQKGHLEGKNKELQSLINRRAADMKEFLKTELQKMQELNEKRQDKEETSGKLNILRDGTDGVAKETDECREQTARIDTQITKLRRDVQKMDKAIDDEIQLREDIEKADQTIAALSTLAHQTEDSSLEEATQRSLEKYNLTALAGEAAAPPA